MQAPPVKEQFRPSLPELLEGVSRPVRRLVWLGFAGLLVLAAAIAIFYPRDPWIVHTGPPVAFDLQYPRAFARLRPPPGAYARTEQRSHGRLIKALEVDPLQLPPYSGDVNAELPIFANTYIAGLASRVSSFELISEGKARVDVFPGYAVSYTGRLDGRPIFGRDVILVPRTSGVRDGVVLAMQSVPSNQVIVPDQIGVRDSLNPALHSFRFRS
jgi:hypothetical protein